MLSRIRAFFARPVRPILRILGRYDAAQTTDENRKYWANADDLSAAAANSQEVRRTLRRRARYACANNPNIAGLIRRVSRDLIGTGPRLQLRIDADPESIRTIERIYGEWCRAVRLADTLRTATAQKLRDGEAFLVFTTNPKLPTQVKLSIRLVEPEQVATPFITLGDPLATDGIRYDTDANPTEYHVLKYHPGGTGMGVVGNPLDYDRVPASEVLHWFRRDRAGQLRGIPEIAPMLPLSAFQHRYLLATLSAAEFAANLHGVLESDLPPGMDPPVDASSPDRIEIERGALLTTPYGMKLRQLEAKQPTAGFRDVNTETLSSMGRAIDAPLNIMTGNSSGYNYSSGRLDHLGYHAGLWVDRDDCEQTILDAIFRRWLAEAVLTGDIPPSLPPYGDWLWEWHWDGFGAIDPIKDVESSTRRMAASLSTLAEECAAEGRDWQEVLRQRAAESAYARSLGLPNPHAVPGAPIVEPEEETA